MVKNNIWKPTAAQAKEIREYAKLRSGSGWVRLELGEKVAGDVYSANILKVAPNDVENDKSSYEQSDFITWEKFRKDGVELVNGEAVLDFYVHDRIELNTNIGVYVLTDGTDSTIVCYG